MGEISSLGTEKMMTTFLSEFSGTILGMFLNFLFPMSSNHWEAVQPVTSSLCTQRWPPLGHLAQSLWGLTLGSGQVSETDLAETDTRSP